MIDNGAIEIRGFCAAFAQKQLGARDTSLRLGKAGFQFLSAPRLSDGFLIMMRLQQHPSRVNIHTRREGIDRDSAPERAYTSLRMTGRDQQKSLIVPSLRQAGIEDQGTLELRLGLFPIPVPPEQHLGERIVGGGVLGVELQCALCGGTRLLEIDRKSTRLNSSH